MCFLKTHPQFENDDWNYSGFHTVSCNACWYKIRGVFLMIKFLKEQNLPLSCACTYNFLSFFFFRLLATQNWKWKAITSKDRKPLITFEFLYSKNSSKKQLNEENLKSSKNDHFANTIQLSPGQTDSQVVASLKLGSTCDSVWPGLTCTCVDLRWLAITLVEIKFARKSMQVSYRLATQRKSLRKFNLPLLVTRGGGYCHLWAIYIRYVPLWRVWFSRSLLWHRVYKSERLGLE